MEKIIYRNRRNTNSYKWDIIPSEYDKGETIPAWVADMDFAVPKCVRDAIIKSGRFGVYGYSFAGKDYYNNFIKWEKKRFNHTIERDWIRFSTGVVAAINWIVQSMTNPGDAIIIQTPVYHQFAESVKSNKRKLICNDLVNTDGVYTINFEDFEKKIKDNNVKMFIMCSPHNPVGRVWKKEELVKMIEICKNHDVIVLSDEIHHDFAFNNNKHIPTMSISDYDKLIMLTSSTKTFNLAALENSIIIIKDKKLRDIYDAKTSDIHESSGNIIGYIAAEAAFGGGEEWLEQVKSIIYSNYELLKKSLLGKYDKLTISPLEGTYLAWVDFGAYLKPEEISDFFKKKCGVIFNLGEDFGGDCKSFVRINLATSKKNIQTICSRIKQNL
ncbi:MAG: pyridoxal phosphate-dependent aminotransferase [Clostridiales bacterium]|nr:pyridoxal phosphate-dependent aminotransferase [Clostridiales bacterium]